MSDAGDSQAEAHRRNHARLRVGIVSRLETLDGNCTARLVDLSQSGAQLILPHPQPLRRAVLCWLDYEAFGLVAWQDGDHVGLEFDELVSMDWLLATRERAPTVVQDEALGGRIAARQWAAGTLSQGSER